MICLLVASEFADFVIIKTIFLFLVFVITKTIFFLVFYLYSLKLVNYMLNDFTTFIFIFTPSTRHIPLHISIKHFLITIIPNIALKILVSYFFNIIKPLKC